jgi:hypothetical protein
MIIKPFRPPPVGPKYPSSLVCHIKSTKLDEMLSRSTCDIGFPDPLVDE